MYPLYKIYKWIKKGNIECCEKGTYSPITKVFVYHFHLRPIGYNLGLWLKLTPKGHRKHILTVFLEEKILHLMSTECSLKNLTFWLPNVCFTATLLLRMFVNEDTTQFHPIPSSNSNSWIPISLRWQYGSF